MAVLDFIKNLFSSKKEVTQSDLLADYRQQYPYYAKAPDDWLAKTLATKMPEQYGVLSTFDPKAPVSPEVVPVSMRDETFYSSHPELGKKDAVSTLTKFREKYPFYKKAPDDWLAATLEKNYPDDPQFKGLAARIPAPAPVARKPGPGIPGYTPPGIKTVSLQPSTETYRNLEAPGKLAAPSKFQQEDSSRVGREVIEYLKVNPSAAETSLLRNILKVPERGAPDIPVLPGVSIPGAPVARTLKDIVLATTFELGGFYKGVTGLDLNVDEDVVKAVESRKISPKLAEVAGEMVGGLALIGGMGSILKAARAGEAVMSVFARTPQLARFLAGGTRAGVEFGGAGAFKEGIRQIKEGTLDLSSFGKTVLMDTALGVGFGGVQAGTAGRFSKALPDALFQSAGASAYGFGSSLLMGHDLASAAISGGIAGLYALAGAKGATEAQKLGAYKTAVENVGRAAHTEALKRGYTAEEAGSLAEAAKVKFTDFANRIKAEKVDIRNWDKVSKDVYAEMGNVFDARQPKTPKPGTLLTGPEAAAPGGSNVIPSPPPKGPVEPIFTLKPDVAELQKGHKVEAKPPAFGETTGQTTIFGTVEPVSGKPVSPAKISEPSLFDEQAKPTFPVPASAIVSAGEPPAAIETGIQTEFTDKPETPTPSKPVRVDQRGIPIRRPGSVVAQVDLGEGKITKITHKQVLDYAKAIHTQELEDWTQKITSDPLRAFVAQHGIKPEPEVGGVIPEHGEWKALPLNLKDAKNGMTASKMAEYVNENKADFGLSPSEEVDINDIYAVGKREKLPPKPIFGTGHYDAAQRELEQFAQEGVGSTAPTSEPQEAFFQKTGRTRRPTGGEASVGSQPIDTFEKMETPEAQKARKDFKLSDKARAIVEKYAKRVGERYTAGNKGVFYPGSENIRVHSLNNLSTVAHEVTHFIDHKFKVVDQLVEPVGMSKVGQPIYNSKYAPFRKELSKLYLEYYPGASEDKPLVTRMREGLATLFQKYVEQPTKINEKYPVLVNSFLKEGGAFHKPIFKEFISDLHGIVKEYQGLDPLEKIGARVTSKFQQDEIKDSYLNFREKFITEIVDNMYPLEKMAKQGNVRRTANDPSLWARQYSNATSLVLQNLRGKSGFWTYKDGEFRKAFDENIRDLVDTLHDKGLTDDFGKWLVARRQVFAHEQLDAMKPGAIAAAKRLGDIAEAARRGELTLISKRDLAELKKTVADYKRLRETLKNDAFDRAVATKAYQAHADTFKPFAELFDKFTKANLELMADPEVGLITQKQKSELLNKEGYASYKRDVYDDILGSGDPVLRSGGGGNKPSSMIGRHGSELTILNPLYSMIRDHAEIVRKSLKQIVVNKITRLADDIPELMQRTDLKTYVDPKTGVISYPQEKDPNILMRRTAKGERIPYLVSREIQQIVSDVLDFQNVHVLERFVRSMNRMFTAGTTAYYPLFAPTNFLIDQISAAAQTRTNYIPIYDSLAQVGKALLNRDSREAELLHEYMVLGGERQTFAGWQTKSPDELLQTIANEKSGLDKVLSALESGAKIVSLPSSMSEIATRASEYIKSRKQGNSQVVALEDAGRVSVPFHHMGRFGGSAGTKGGKVTVGQTFVKSIPFFNPGIQALAHYMRTVKDGDTRNRALFVTLAAMAASVAASYWMMKKATKEQQQAFADLEPEELANYLWLPAPDGKRVMKIRMPEQMLVFATMLNMAMWESAGKADYKAGDYVAAATAFLPDQVNITSPQRMFLSVMPQVVKPLINVIYNKRDWPKVRPMISMGLEQKEPRLQFNDNTAKFAVWLGNKLNISPIKVDYLIDNYLGRLSRPFVGKPIANPFLREWWFTAGRNLQDYYEERQATEQVWNSYQKDARPFTAKEVEKVERQIEQIRYIDQLLAEYRVTESDKDVPEKLRQKNVESLRNEILDEVAKFRQGVKVK